MSTHRRSRPRKARRPDARWLVTGLPAAARIRHHGQQAYLQPVRAGDHPRRYSTGQRLALKPYIPGPTAAHLIVTAVEGPRERFRLGQVDDVTARELGYDGMETFRLTWVRDEDADWFERTENEHRDEHGHLTDLEDAYAKVQARFEQRWAPKLAWLLRFRLDHAAAPRMLAAAPSIYDPMKEDDEGRDEDRGYTTSDARSLPGEHPALTDLEWETHVGPRSVFRERARLRAQRREREAREWPERLRAARAAARIKGYDIRDECRRFDRLIERREFDQALEQLRRIEGRVFPVAA